MITTKTQTIFEKIEEKREDALDNQRNIIWAGAQYPMNDFVGSLLNELIKNDGIERTFAYKLTEDALRVKIFYTQDVSGIDTQNVMNDWFEFEDFISEEVMPIETKRHAIAAEANNHWNEVFNTEVVPEATSHDSERLLELFENDLDGSFTYDDLKKFVQVRVITHSQVFFDIDDVENAWQRAHDE